jgi:hypothetical protein
VVLGAVQPDRSGKMAFCLGEYHHPERPLVPVVGLVLELQGQIPLLGQHWDQ